MRTTVEIGLGREARRTYSLHNISLTAARRTRSSKDVDTHWTIDAYQFDVPFVSHPTDALTSVEFLSAMGDAGGLGVINAEGLWGRVEDLDGAIAAIADCVRTSGDGAGVKLLQKLHSRPLDEDLLARRIADVRALGHTVAVRVTPQHARTLAPIVMKAGAEILFIQGTVISAEHVAEGEQPLNLKEFIGSLDVPVIAGGVTDYSTAMHLMRAGAAGVIVGGGDNANEYTLGIGTGMATAIADVAAARRDYLDETGGRYVHILADDGEINSTANAVKAIACGADAVVLGHVLAAAQETPAGGTYWTHASAHPRFPRGVVQYSDQPLLRSSASWCVTGSDDDGAGDGDTAAAAVEHVSEFSMPLQRILHGPSVSVHGGVNYVGALRRAMAKCGYTDLKRFQKAPLNIRF